MIYSAHPLRAQHTFIIVTLVTMIKTHLGDAVDSCALCHTIQFREPHFTNRAAFVLGRVGGGEEWECESAGPTPPPRYTSDFPSSFLTFFRSPILSPRDPPPNSGFAPTLGLLVSLESKSRGPTPPVFCRFFRIPRKKEVCFDRLTARIVF